MGSKQSRSQDYSEESEKESEQGVGEESSVEDEVTHTATLSKRVSTNPISKVISEVFNENAIDGKLYFSGFKQALRIMENLGLRRLRDTPLGNRLFHAFDENNQKYLEQAEYMKGANILVNGTENEKLSLTYKAYCDKKKGLQMEDVWNFISESWLVGFCFLSDHIREHAVDGAPVPSAQDLEALAQRADPKLRLLVLKGLMDCMPENGYAKPFDISANTNLDDFKSISVDKTCFFKWARKDRSIIVSWNSHSIEVPNTLLNVNQLAMAALNN